MQARARRRPCGLATPRIVSKSDLQNAFPGKLIRNKYIAVRLGDAHQLKRIAHHAHRATKTRAAAKMLPIEVGEIRHSYPAF